MIRWQLEALRSFGRTGRSGRADPIGPADDTIMTNHYMIRDGAEWRCLNACGHSHPFPGGIPESIPPCVPRRWGDQ